jgi:DNA-binding beta-propeller fold protein YncE
VNRRQFLAAAALAAAAPRAALAAAAGPYALVTCDAESRLAVVDLRSPRLMGSLATLPDPRSIEAVGARALVCHTAVGALSIVERRRVAHVVHGLDEPRYAAAHPDGRHAFVTDSGRSGVVVVDVVAGRVLDRVALPGWARHISITPDGRTLYVGLGSASEHVAVVDTRTLHREALLTPGFLAHDVAVAPDGRLWVTAGEAGMLAVGARRLVADRAPQHVTFGEGRAFVTSGDSGTLHVQAPDGRILARAAVPTGSYNVQYANGRVVTASLGRGTLAVFDARGGHLGTLAVSGSCHDAAILAS